MRALSLGDRQLVIDHVKTEALRFSSSASEPQQHITHGNTNPSPPAKRHCNGLHDFDDLPVEEESQADEVEKYQKFLVQGSDSILQWWKNNEHHFPVMARIARKTLCIMATSAASERNFSLAGHIVSSRRTSLAPSSVDNILFMNSYLKM